MKQAINNDGGINKNLINSSFIKTILMMMVWITKNKSDFETEGELEYKLNLWLSWYQSSGETIWLHFPYVALIYIWHPSHLCGFALMNFARNGLIVNSFGSIYVPNEANFKNKLMIYHVRVVTRRIICYSRARDNCNVL